MATRTPDSLTVSGSSASARSIRRWSDDREQPTPGHRHHSLGDAFGYADSNTPNLQPRYPREAALILDTNDVTDHHARFMSDPEKLLAVDPRKTRQSFRELLDNPDGESVAWHQISADRVLAQLQVNIIEGLTDQEAKKRLLQFGRNALESERRAPIYIVFLLQFWNLIIMLLMAAAVASIALQEFVEGAAIIAIVTLNAVIATVQENRAGNALEALAKLASPMCTVLREHGKQQKIASDTLVPGDIVLLTTGDIVPADMRLFSSADCKVNEMILTGESEDVRKKAGDLTNAPKGKDSAGTDSEKLTPDNMVFASTSVSSGNATGVVVATGMRTKVGSIAALLGGNGGMSADGKSKTKKSCCTCLAQYTSKMTPLQEALHKLGILMGAAVLVVCAVVFAVGMLRGSHDPKNADRPIWLTMVMVAVSLAVSAVPEGLPMVVTICLSTGTAEMVKRHVLVRKLAAVESLGAASVICTDKTGTLTEGRMTALKAWADFTEYAITSNGSDPTGGELLLDGQKQTRDNNPLLHASLLSAALCSNATFQRERDPETGEITVKRFGNASEAPLVAAAAKMGIRLGEPEEGDQDLADQYPRVLEIPFNSARKMMLTVTSVSANAKSSASTLGDLSLPAGSRYCAHVKGAPNFILPLCAEMASKSSTGAANIRPMAEGDRVAILEAVDELSSQALRVLAIAIHPLTHIPFAVDASNDEELDVDAKFRLLSAPLVFLGLVASMDPPRQGVDQSVAIARTAGIRTVMITGDYLKTAAAIAKNIGLLGLGADVDEQAVDCAVLRPRGPGQYLTDPDMDEITSRVAVFARAQPEDKLEIVRSLQRQGYVTAMTGDGVNDAPALKEADIGVAMGLAGTEVAKGAADMILTTDNFCAIVDAVEKGRAIYTNIQKFVCFLLSTNFGEISIIFTAIAAGMPNPLEPLQILVLNLFADGMAAVALSLEKGDPAEMLARPRSKAQPIIHGRLWALVIANAVLIGVGALTVFATGLYWNFGSVLQDDILDNGGLVSKLVNENIYVNVRCSRWEGASDAWKLLGNCAARYNDGSRVFPNAGTESEYESTDAYCRSGDYECVTEGVARAQTMAFIYITTMEMFRAYTARSFTNAVCVGFLDNGYMQMAAIGSIALTLFVTNTPVVMDDLFGFAPIEWFQWLFAMGTAFVCATLGEVLKCAYRRRDREIARWDAVTDGFASVLLELRHLRHHVEHLEDKLEVATHKPARRLEVNPRSTSSRAIDITVV